MAKLPMKDDLNFAEHNSKAVAASAEELRAFVTLYESLEMERNDVSREMTDQMTVMKSKGYDVAALRRVLKERKRDKAELDAERETAQLYMELLR